MPAPRARTAPPTPPTPAPKARTAPPTPPAREARTAHLARPSTKRDAPSPAALVSAGRHREALSAAARVGWPKVLTSASVETLAALGDAARLAGAAERARRIYRAVRRRFPGRRPAARAAYCLGLLAVKRRDHGGAAMWFEVYLRERPRGELAREASGRLIEARLGAGDRPAARAAARAYLKRHPGGPHAALARATLAAGTKSSGKR